MVSAGITLANVIMPKQKGEAAVALPGCIINICFGTFVEASYPFMFSNKIPSVPSTFLIPFLINSLYDVAALSSALSETSLSDITGLRHLWQMKGRDWHLWLQ